MILKRDVSENKICTLYVFPKYRNFRIGTTFVECAIGYLNTTFPFITVPVAESKTFEKLLTKYNFVETSRDDRHIRYNERRGFL